MQKQQEKKLSKKEHQAFRIQEHGYGLAEGRAKVKEDDLALYFADGDLTNREIARETGWNENTIGRYRKRWLSQQLVQSEAQGMESRIEAVSCAVVQPDLPLELERQEELEEQLRRMYAKHLALTELEQDVEEKRKRNNLVKEDIKAALLGELQENKLSMHDFPARELDFIEKLLNG